MVNHKISIIQNANIYNLYFLHYVPISPPYIQIFLSKNHILLMMQAVQHGYLQPCCLVINSNPDFHELPELPQLT